MVFICNLIEFEDLTQFLNYYIPDSESGGIIGYEPTDTFVRVRDLRRDNYAREMNLPNTYEQTLEFTQDAVHRYATIRTFLYKTDHAPEDRYWQTRLI